MIRLANLAGDQNERSQLYEWVWSDEESMAEACKED